ncbi:MAG: peptidoglycan editing factor PgeF [Deltaproteobacteria bacterium]|nr:peptidoglycan editing factor PgeF [Deltaproteobacteria bacterium]
MLQAPLLLSVGNVVHGFSTREGGVSVGAYSSLNLGQHVGDQRPAVVENRARLLAGLGCVAQRWVSLSQVHGADVVEVTRNASRSIEADGLWTRDPEVAIAILVADCVPVVMTDAAGSFVAAVHAGWRGTAARIVEAMVRRLEKDGTKADQLRVALGPAIGPCCYKVGADVATALQQAVPTATQVVSTNGAGDTVADLWATNRAILEAVGVPPTQIHAFRLCTSCSTGFFSHRRDKGLTGRQAGVIALAPRRR